MAISLLPQPVGAAPNPAKPLVQIFDSAAYAPGNQPPDPRSGNYWLKAIISNVISDNGVSGVKISLQANLNDDPAAYIERVAFNLNPFRQIQPRNKLRCAATTPNICTGNPFKEPKPAQWGYLFEDNDVDLPNRASGFDFELILPNSNKANRLTGTEHFDIIVDGLTRDAFNATNNGDDDEDNEDNSTKGLYAAAKLNGYGGSATLLDPPFGGTPPDEVPGPLPLLGAAAAFKASRRLRSRLKTAAAAAPQSA
jgi:hypothetical protein